MAGRFRSIRPGRGSCERRGRWKGWCGGSGREESKGDEAWPADFGQQRQLLELEGSVREGGSRERGMRPAIALTSKILIR